MICLKSKNGYKWKPRNVSEKTIHEISKKNTEGNTEEPSMLSWEKTSCHVLKNQNGNNSKPKYGFRKTFMVMVENPFMVIVRTINVKSQKSNNDLLETTNGITQKHNNGK